MKKLSRCLIPLILAVYAGVTFATFHAGYVRHEWKIFNYCSSAVTVIITDEDGVIEVQKTIQAGQEYQQHMNRGRTNVEHVLPPIKVYQANHLYDKNFEISFAVGSGAESVYIYIPTWPAAVPWPGYAS